MKEDRIKIIHACTESIDVIKLTGNLCCNVFVKEMYEWLGFKHCW